MKPPIEVRLPDPFLVPIPKLITFYIFVLLFDYVLIRNEHRLPISRLTLRWVIVVWHIMIPLTFQSYHAVANIFLTCGPWFIGSCGMFLASRCKTFQEWFGALCGATLCFEENPDSVASGNVRLGGWIKFARALCKYCFMRYCVDPLLCSDPVDILALRPYDPYALFQTVLLGVKAYCVLGFTDAFMGLVQLTLNVPLIDFFDSPILAYSPRDFWSRRWNKVVRNLFHRQIFSRKTGKDNVKDKKDDDEDLQKTPTKNGEATKDLPAPSSSLWYWSARNGRGIAVFITSGFMHEFLIMAIVRRLTLEQVLFFFIQGVAVSLDVNLRQGKYKKHPTGLVLCLCIATQLTFMAFTGQIFIAPYIRYGTFDSVLRA